MACVDRDSILIHFFEALRGDVRFWQVQQVLDEEISESEKAAAIRTWLETAEKVAEVELLSIGVSVCPKEVRERFPNLHVIRRANPLKDY